MSPKKAKQDKTKKRGKQTPPKRKGRAEKKARLRDQFAALMARVEALEARVATLEAAAAPRPPADPLTAIPGIGPRYAERLRTAGVASVTDLVEVDPEGLAEQTGIPRKTIRHKAGVGRVDWIFGVMRHTGKTRRQRS